MRKKATTKKAAADPTDPEASQEVGGTVRVRVAAKRILRCAETGRTCRAGAVAVVPADQYVASMGELVEGDVE